MPLRLMLRASTAEPFPGANSSISIGGPVFISSAYTCSYQSRKWIQELAHTPSAPYLCLHSYCNGIFLYTENFLIDYPPLDNRSFFFFFFLCFPLPPPLFLVLEGGFIILKSISKEIFTLSFGELSACLWILTPYQLVTSKQNTGAEAS